MSSLHIRVALATLAVAASSIVPAVTSSATGHQSRAKSSDPQVWLCNPTVTSGSNPCESSLLATSISATGSKTTQKSSDATSPKIDCFYVYPTVSLESTLNANLVIQPVEKEIAVAQASRFSADCRVFAPMYPQVTTSGLFTANGVLSGTGTSQGQRVAFAGLLTAWKDYLSRYNDGRGVVLIGHSQGAFLLRELITDDIDKDASVRKLVVSAILLGGNVQVPKGKLVGGDFQHVPACTTSSETGCVIAYSTYSSPPPSDSHFGRTTTAGDQILCTNPAALAGDGTALSPYFPTNQDLSYDDVIAVGRATTPWVTYPTLMTASCENKLGATYLQFTETRRTGDTRPLLTSTLPATWGLHLQDFNIALGNLVRIVKTEATSYVAH